MLKSEAYLERGDAPAQAVLCANAEQQAVRKAIETQEELHKIRERVCITLSAYEIGEELEAKNQSNVEDLKNAFVKDDTELEFVDDMAMLYFILSDPIAKRKYQQKVTIFVVGYENLCSQRNRLLLQLQQFFSESTANDDSFTVCVPEFDFDEVENNIRDALDKAEKTTERLANISKDVLKVFEMVNPKDNKKGKKKLEKALFQSQQDVMHLTEKLVGVQSDLEDAKTKLTTIEKQLEVKDSDIERLKLQVNSSKVFEKECNELRKGLQAKEQQLQGYRTRMDEVELSLSRAEGKYDQYVEICRNLKDENQCLKDEIEARLAEHQQKLIEIRKELETKYDKDINDLKTSQEQELTKLRETYEDEALGLREKLDMMRRRSLNTAGTSAPPESRDSARFTSSESALSMWKSSAKTVRTELKNSEGSRLNTAASTEVSEVKEKDSALERSSSIFVSMSNTPLPRTPKTAETLRLRTPVRSRETNPVRPTAESSTQTDEVMVEFGDEVDAEVNSSEIRDVKSRNDLLEIEREMVKTPTNEFPQKLEEYKNKFSEIEQQLQEEVLQWKLRFNTKSQALSELKLTQEKQLKEIDELMEQLSVVEEKKAAAEQEAEKAILQLEEFKAEKDGSLDEEDVKSLDVVQTESKGTTTSASLYRMQNTENEPSYEVSVGIQCPSAQLSGKPSMRSPQFSDTVDEQEMLFGGLQASDSGFEGSSNVLHPDETERYDIQNPRSPSSIASSGRVRSRLVRSALKDHKVVVETVRTYEMITEFKMNIVVWLQQHGLEHKSELLTTIPDINLNKDDELDVLSKMSAIRDTTQLILDALWQITKDDYSWSQEELNVANGDAKNNEEKDVYEGDVEVHLASATDSDRLSSSFVDDHARDDDRKVDVGVQKDLQAQPVLSARRHKARPTPTTPKGYTRLLHEYNNLNEEYIMLTGQLEENVKSYQEQINENAAVMNEMQETINSLKSQLMMGTNGQISTQPSISSLMFTRLDAERNVKSMKRAVLTKRLSQNSYNTVIQDMSEYINLPGRRLAELVKRYRHHCFMKNVEENLNPVRMTSAEVYNLQERMEYLQRKRAVKWSEKMTELARERCELGEKITSSLKEIEENSGIFLIKPVYSYVTRSPKVVKSSHPVICKKRLSQAPPVPSETTSKPKHPLETSQSPGFTFRQNINRPMWNSKDSHASENKLPFDDISIPRLLAMDVNRFTLSKNLISGSIDMKTDIGSVRQYVTIERPIGSSKPVQIDRQPEAPSPSSHALPGDSHDLSPGSFPPYPPLPPISLPHQSSASITNQSPSSFSMTSPDENFAR